MPYQVKIKVIIKTAICLFFFYLGLPFTIINPCPAEPGYTLPLQTV